MADTIKTKQNGKTRAQLITILMQAYGRPVTAREIMNIIYPGNKNESQVSDELRYMLQQGKVVRTGTPQKYFYELPEKKSRNYFYVMQNKTFAEEYGGGYLWAPQKGNNGSAPNHSWLRMQDVKAGDVIAISGQILTARDQAHKRILEEGAPIDIEGAVLFHAGPIIQEEENKDDSEPKYKMVAVGPTTSMRMNPYEADVLDMGAKIIIGKGGMDDSVREALKRNNAVYVVATGGCAALYVDKVNEIKGVNWLDLGMPEAIWDLDVDSFGPLIVAMDSEGNSLYD